jgi:tetratricopeptide (TPR) repeat protein
LTTFDIVGALRSTEEANSILSDLGDLEGEMMASQCLATIFAFIGDVSNADANYSKTAALGSKLGSYSQLAWTYLYWGLLHEASGANERALALTVKGLEITKLLQQPYVEIAIWASLVRLYIKLNRMKEAESAYFQMNKLSQEHGRDASLTLRSAVKRPSPCITQHKGKINLQIWSIFRASS